MKSPPTRILFIDHTSVLGGGELALIALVRELDRTRFAPVVLLFSQGPLVAEMEAIAETHLLLLPPEFAEARREGTAGGGLPWNKGMQLVQFLMKLYEAVESLRPDLIHTNSLKADLLGGMAAKLHGVPLLWHIRDRISEDYLPRTTVRFLRAACRWIPDGLIANSRATLEALQLPETKLARVISSGIDLSPFVAAAQVSETLPTAMAAGHEVRIGLIGRICTWKGQDVFLRAAALVHDSFPTAKFFVVGAPLFGEEEYEQTLRRLAVDLGLEEAVVFTGFRRDISAVISNLHLIVHASTIPEPFGQVIVQGMAASRPVVASEGGGPSEIIEDGRTGFLVARSSPELLAAALLRLLSEPELAHAVAVQGQKAVLTRYGSDVTTRMVEDLYLELLARQ